MGQTAAVSCFNSHCNDYAMQYRTIYGEYIYRCYVYSVNSYRFA